MSASPASPKQRRGSARTANVRAGAPRRPAAEPVVPEGSAFSPLPRSMGWLPFCTFVLSVVGFLDSGYQTYTHYTSTGLLGCSTTGDACVVVQSSQYAYVFGIPVAVLGLAFYAFMVVACSPPAWRSRLPVLGWLRLASVIVGMLFVLYLVYCEIIKLDQICPYCTSVHIITFVLFTLIVYRSSAPGALNPAAPATTRRGR